MNQPRTSRAILAMAVLAFFLPSFALAAKNDDSGKGGKPLRVAILPFVNSTQEIGATKMMDDVMRDQLKEVSRAIFLMPGDVERILSGLDQLGKVDLITDRWAKYRTLDSTAVTGLDSLLTVDAILCVKISEWENHRVPVVGMGQSSATVGLSFALYDIATKKLLWSKDPREQRFGAELDPATGSANYDETGVIQRKSDNQPPRYEAVAGDLVRDAFKKFPQK
ncbi:MAG TPA: hypothetical protein VF363_00465 [Candidatus Eisenbacteria bacterium]